MLSWITKKIPSLPKTTWLDNLIRSLQQMLIIIMLHIREVWTGKIQNIHSGQTILYKCHTPQHDLFPTFCSRAYHFFAKLDKCTLQKVTYIYQKGPKTAIILKNGQNSNSKTVLESVLVTDSKNGFKFKFFSWEVTFSEYQK